MSDVIRIRMYDVGFGDCFWVDLPTTEGPRRLLIDCGTNKAGRAKVREVVRDLLADARRPDGTCFDVVALSHRHRDHLSGFSEPGWAAVTPREVWLPWTENAQDPLAVRFTARLEARRRALAAQAAALGPALGATERFLLENAALNADAMATLHAMAGRTPARAPLHLAAQAEGLTRCPTTALPGVDVFVLGPGRDAQALNREDPPDAENYAHPGLRAAARARGAAAAASGSETTPRPGPFAARWGLPPGDRACPPPLHAQDLAGLRRAIEPDLLGSLAGLDAEINNTSLLLVIRVGGTHLLFPGDAQWGPWEQALGDPARRALLERTRFLKVGHHGSENATPRTFGDHVLPPGGIGMISYAPFGAWRIPEEHLVDALRSTAQMTLGTSREDAPPAPFQAGPDGRYLEVEIPVTA